MARTKIRKTFKYPEENELDPVIDEQEQEQVIETLANQDASITAAYKPFFVVLPMLAAIYYLCATVYILLGFASSSSPLQYTLGLASLIVTTTIALEIPTSSGSIFDQSILRGPILQMAKPYLVDVNAYLGGVSCIIAGSMGAGEYFDMGPWVPAIPPLLMFGMVWLARRELRPIDVKGLRNLTYDYKGA